MLFQNEEIEESIKRHIADCQGKLFEYACNQHFDMEKFSVAFMNSFLCKGNDTSYSPHQYNFPALMLSYLGDEVDLDSLKRTDDLYDNSDVAEYTGYIWRELSIRKNLPSKEIIKYISYRDMTYMYIGLHTVMSTELVVDDLYDYYCQRKAGIVESVAVRIERAAEKDKLDRND